MELTKYIKTKKIAIVLFMLGVLLGVTSQILLIKELSIVSFIVLLAAVIQFFRTMKG